MYPLLLAALAVALLFATPVFGLDQFTPGVGGAEEDSFFTVGANSARDIRVAMEANRSYECSVQNASLSTNVFTVDLVDANTFAQVSTLLKRSCADITPMNVSTSGYRLCVSPTNTAVFRLRVFNSANAPGTFRLSCMETSLYGGFNTFANPFNFLELTNLTNAALDVRIRAIDFNGNVLIDNLARSIPANRRVDLDVHTLVGPSKFGTITVVHNGPYGAVRAVVSQYAGPIEALNFKVSTPVTPREQRLP